MELRWVALVVVGVPRPFVRPVTLTLALSRLAGEGISFLVDGGSSWCFGDGDACAGMMALVSISCIFGDIIVVRYYARRGPFQE